MRCRTCDYLSREVRDLLLHYLYALQVAAAEPKQRARLAPFDLRMEARRREIRRHQMECIAATSTRFIM